MSGTATIFSRRSERGVNHSDGEQLRLEMQTTKLTIIDKSCPSLKARRANAYSEDSSARSTYALRLDNLTFHTEVNATLASD